MSKVIKKDIEGEEMLSPKLISLVYSSISVMDYHCLLMEAKQCSKTAQRKYLFQPFGQPGE